VKKAAVPLVFFLLWFLSALAMSAQSREIFELLRKGDVPAVKALIEKSPRLVDERDGDGHTPLHYRRILDTSPGFDSGPASRRK
jgi:hypothetical protein